MNKALAENNFSFVGGIPAKHGNGPKRLGPEFSGQLVRGSNRAPGAEAGSPKQRRINSEARPFALFEGLAAVDYQIGTEMGLDRIDV